jgi:uracil-DNA glycosylase
MRRYLPLLLEAHAAALAACRRCGHTDDVVPTVSSAPSPKVMLVGQAPGRTEATSHRPFAGRAGNTLFRWLARAGLDEATARERIYIAAITRCYPGPSPSGRGDRVPSPRERDLCAGWLDEELRMIRPRLLIPVGRLAIDRFLGARPLDELIGRRHDADHVGGRSIAIPLPHPSGASSWIHQAGHMARLHRALDLIGSELETLGLVPRRTPRRSVA